MAHATPELLQADLAPLVQLLAWGVSIRPSWHGLTHRPRRHSAGLGVLESCGAVSPQPGGAVSIDTAGRADGANALHPRLAHMLLVGSDIHAQETACLLAAILSERNPVRTGYGYLCQPGDAGWESRYVPRAGRLVQAGLAAGQEPGARLGLDNKVHRPGRAALGSHRAMWLACCWPALPRSYRAFAAGGDGTRYLLSNGRSAVLPAEDFLVGAAWLAVAEIGGARGEAADRILRPARLDPECFDAILSHLVRDEERVEWDYRANQFVAQRRRLIGSIVLASEPLAQVSPQARSGALLGSCAKSGLDILPRTPALRQWRARAGLLRRLDLVAGDDSRWPDLSDDALLVSLEEWLLPYLGQVRRLEDFQQLDLKAILFGRLSRPLPLDLERLAPERMAVPSGSVIAIDYCQDPRYWRSSCRRCSAARRHRRWRRARWRCWCTCCRRPSGRCRSPATWRVSGATATRKSNAR